MIDGIKAFYRSQEAHDRLLLENKQGLVFSGHVGTGAVEKHSGKDRGLFVDVIEPTKPSLEPGISLRGSLHNYWKGHNDGLLKYKEAVKAITTMCGDYYVDPEECEVHNLEIGVNISAKSPEALINSAMLYHGRTGKRNPKNKHFSKTWEFDQYIVKLYKKGPDLVRYELRIREMAKLSDNGIRIRYLSDLCDYTNYVRLLRFLYESVDDILFVPADREHRLPPADEAKWNAYRSDAFWEELDSSPKNRKSAEAREIVHKYHLIDWDSFLRHGIIYQGSRMLETSPWCVSAMFSALGLHNETVAGPKGGRDRQAVENVVKTIPIHNHPVVANVGWFWNVIIFIRSSYFPLEMRGPPSVFPVFLFIMYEYNVALLIPVVLSISLIGMVPASYNASACSMALALALGRPPLRPRTRAAASPSIVRSRVRSRSN